MSTLISRNRSHQHLIDARLDAIEQFLMDNRVSRSERSEIISVGGLFRPIASDSRYNAIMVIYSVDMATGKMLPADTIEVAKLAILARYPKSHFGTWQTSRKIRSLPAWRSTEAMARYNAGDKRDENKPVAYVQEQDWRIKFPPS